jgi:predicted ATPase/GAF domain-containing protein/two-component sensor histidine kinase
MLSIPGYQITEVLHLGIKTMVYRGYREHDQSPAIFKTLAAEYPARKDLARLQHEYALTKDWNESGLMQAYDLVPYQNNLVLISADIGGSSIRQLLEGKAMTVGEFLPFAIAFAKNLNQIHHHKIIHKDINPSNLVINMAFRQVQIIDFGISSQLSRETAVLQNPGHLEGTLAYLSPEQTGRMNRSVDYRTDFYSLGATFYEMLTGMPPFAATDPMELVHCHLAKTPPPAHEAHPGLPPILSQLVQKLMAKTAEQRYQSAFGLIADLETCQQQWLATQQHGTPTIADFDLGRHDVSERFQIPQKLYGREAEIAQLLHSFTRTSRGPAEMLLVAGYSGVGKTALVYEVHKAVTESQGYFIAGKFDQFQRDIPYASLIVAFQELMRQLLTESTAQIARWKTLLEQALGVNAQVIMEVIPEVEWIMGPQPPVPELPPNQALNRFNLVFQQFIRTFANKEHPLVLFLDDLQWADLPSLKLIQLFMTEPDTQYLFVIGAYRDNEVSAAHPLMLTLEEISKGAVRIGTLAPATLTLLPLDEGHIRQLLDETLHFNSLFNKTQNLPQGELIALAKLCFEKTQGNPFFLNQFLRALVEARKIAFNHAEGRWEWDMEILKQTPITNNVVELMAEKIQSLPANTQAILQLAACVGNHFDLNTLALAWEQSVMATSQALWPAVQADLLIPLDQSYCYLSFEAHSEANFDFKFVHDRIQQAAYSLILDASKAVIQLRIGRLLLAHLATKAANTREERIFDLVYHLNRGRELLTEPSEKEELARLNLNAGRKAKSSAAYKPALAYFQIGLTLIGEQGWATHYELTLALSVAATEAAYLAGDFEKMDQLAKIVLQKGKTLLDQVKVYEVQIQAYIARDQSIEAIQIALPVLKRLGGALPNNPNKLHLIRALLEIKWVLKGKRVEDLIHLPHMTEAVPLAAMQILSSIVPAAYFVRPDLLPLIIFKQVLLTIKYGNTALSAFAYAVYGMILCGVLGDISLGYRFGNLAASTLGHFSANPLKAKVMFIVESMVRQWSAPFRERLQPMLEAYQSGVETGDFEYAAYAAHDHCVFLFAIGSELPELRRKIEKYAEAMVQYKQELTLGWQKAFEQTVLNLSGACADPCRFLGPSYNEETNPVTPGNRTMMFLVSAHKLVLCYLLREYPKALEQAMVAEQYMDSIVGSPSGAVCHFYLALARLAMVAQTPEALRPALLKKATAIQKKIHKLSRHAPMNYLHKWHLLEAERARVRGADLEAMANYDQAIALARENGFPHEAALANELTGQFYLARGQEKVARAYVQDAYYGYKQWGAGAKVQQMEAQHPFLVAKVGSHTATNDTSTSVLRSEALDLSTVMKATQAISGEIVLEHLLEKLMRILIESAGAQHGMLLLETNDEWRIEAEGCVDEEKVRVLQSQPLVSFAPFDSGGSALSDSALPTAPVVLIQYVALTKESVVLDNATMQGRFTSDPYISQHLPKSVLCAPILQQGKLAGILYLENNLMEGAFTADRLEVLKILSSQAAISIENARVYENLETTVERRTSELHQKQVELVDANLELNESIEALNQSNIALNKSNTALNDANAGLVLSVDTLRQLGDIGREITANLDADIVFQSLYMYMGGLLDASVMTIYRMNPATSTLDGVFGRDAGEVIPIRNVALDSPTSNAARAVRERQELLLHYGPQDELPQIPGTRQVCTALFSPLIVDDRVLGVMSVQSIQQNAYGERECLIFRTLSAYGAIAMANATAIAALRQAQNQLVQQEKMASLGGLVAGIAHEINTPLGTALVAISGVEAVWQSLQKAISKGSLSKSVLESSTSEGIEYTALALKTATRTAELIALFKTVSVNTANDRVVAVDLADYLEEISSLVRTQLLQNGCQLEVIAPVGLIIQTVLEALTEALSRVLVNVLNHAFADGRTGTLRLGAQVDEANGGDEVVITVSDNGSGIAPEALPKVFDPFFTTKNRMHGHVGLGLHVAYNHVMERLKGGINITSKVGEGTTVTIRLKKNRQ